ncbi:hypothetical protein [Terribacillus saccharophilus]|uniref:hypothetical protein n=1 Tax=Terribacillus saccharophilus TaxID=361277 RepID=UPI002989FC6B|nr:hypothetical protein [Terribacillus saccharophilus]MCM3227551.1 hypothetical protein [Terribacillus saccharophilus]
MYFVNDAHETNFKHLFSMVFPKAPYDKEYAAVSYLLAIPEIYQRCIHDSELHESPLQWTVKYKVEITEDDGEEMKSVHSIEDENGNDTPSEGYSSLDYEYKHFVKLAENLFNGNEDFNLTRAFSSWDQKSVKVFYQAMEIRFGKFPL